MGLFGKIFGGGKTKKRIEYPADLRPLIDRAMNGLQLITAAHDGMWQISRAAWSVNQDEGMITFDSPEGIRATAPVQFVGSYNTQDQSWLWAWANPSLEAPLTEDAKKVRSFGQEKGYEVLTTPKLNCSEAQGWELAALTNMICESQGAYRGPAGSTNIFMTFGQVKMSKPS